jgi:hypothetical protein
MGLMLACSVVNGSAFFRMQSSSARGGTYEIVKCLISAEQTLMVTAAEMLQSFTEPIQKTSLPFGLCSLFLPREEEPLREFG